MEANGGSQWPEDYGIAMVVSSRGLVAWVPAQAMAQNRGRGALAAAVRQNAWVPAEAAARTGWIPPPGMLFVEGDHARALALRHGWAQGPRTGFAAADLLYLACLCLPAQEVARTRRVCRLWRVFAATEGFHRRHHDNRRGTPMPLFFFVHPDLVGFDLRAVDIRGRVSRPVLRFTPPPSNEVLRIRGSCAGILLLSFGDDLYAFNPCTRRWADLPPIHAGLPPLHVGHDIIGFYTTGGGADMEWQVLYHHIICCTYWIYTLGTPEGEQRCIGRPGPVELDLDLVLADGIVYSYQIPPVLVLHFLHWLPRPAHGNRDILVFDTNAETFATIPPPSIQVGGQDVLVVGHQLFEIDHHLAMTVRSPATAASVDVWVRSNEVWSRQYRIPLPVEAIHQHNVSVFAVAQDRNLNLLVCCMHVLLQCDAMGAVHQSYRLAEHFTLLSGHTIQESLLLHPFLPESPDDADDDMAFFQDQ